MLLNPGLIRGHHTSFLTGRRPAAKLQFMARLARVVVPGYPHHVTQRGNRRQQIFFNDDDYRAYRELMADWCARCVNPGTPY